VYGYVAYRVGDGPDAEDITSETFERALRYSASYDSRKGAPINWLIGIAQRIIAGYGRLPEVPVAEVPTSGDGAGEPPFDEVVVLRLVVRTAMTTLSESDQELLALRYGADMKVKQIAELLGMRANSVEVALHRARKRLGTSLERENDEDELSDVSSGEPEDLQMRAP
jgi:RNA polymerase sigma factor (sigma-70 family)